MPTGIDASHSDLMGAVIEDEGFSVSDRNATRRDWLNDENGHGTSVAGIIAARDGGGQGIVGVARGEHALLLTSPGFLQVMLQVRDECINVQSQIAKK